MPDAVILEERLARLESAHHDPKEEAMNEDDSATVARAFHEAYERLAPRYSYKTREASAVPWNDVPDDNRSLMVAVVDTLLRDGVIEVPDASLDPVVLERLARLESALAHLARMMMRLPQGHATVAEYARLREIAERVEGADDA